MDCVFKFIVNFYVIFYSIFFCNMNEYWVFSYFAKFWWYIIFICFIIFQSKVLFKIWQAACDPKKWTLSDLHLTSLLDPYSHKIWINSHVSFYFYSRSKFGISLSLYTVLLGSSNSFRTFVTLYFYNSKLIFLEN